MKKYKLFKAAVFIGCTLAAMKVPVTHSINTIYAQEADNQIITNDENGIPDGNLYKALLNECDSNNDGILTADETNDVYTVNLRDCNINSLKGISCLKGTHSLFLDNNNISDITELGSMKSLETITICNNNISDISALAPLQLTFFSATDNNIKDISALNNKKYLTHIYLDNNKVENIPSLADLKYLEYLSLDNNNISDINVFKGNKSIKYISLNNNNISDISGISGMEQLIMLNLGNNHVSDISALNNCNNLNQLELNDNNITDISPIKNAYNMSTLYLDNNNISDITALSQYASLNELKLQNNKISNIEPLKALFESCSFKVNFDDFLYYYNSMDNLRGNIVLYGNKITRDEYLRVLPDYIINYNVYFLARSENGDVLSNYITDKKWIDAQKPYMDESHDDNQNDNNNQDNIIRGSVQLLWDGNWYYVVNDNIDYTYNGLAQNEYGWWKITGGAVDFTYNGLAENEYGWWKITNGAVDFTYNGMAENEYGWWKITNGMVDFNYTGLASNDYGVWYMVNGCVAFDFTGTFDNMYIINGCVQNHVHNWIHYNDEYKEDYIPIDELKKDNNGYVYMPQGYTSVYEDHYVCNGCKKDFGTDINAVVEHLVASDFYTGCSNYFLEQIRIGVKKTILVSQAHDECSVCGAIR